MAIAVRRTYACPTCRESFTKWGLCQGHVRYSAPCRDALGDKLEDLDALQELCRAAAASTGPATEPALGATVVVPSADGAPPIADAPPAAAWAAPGLVSDQPFEPAPG
eukprot:CAMPEP_0203909844 /NCGR_PEP_ID=MMETSP0359-20131031/51113_1 /ASSEMBLY_ACC=CAM_ASM_000338 /TAXON_ID=268821 /ORGANISM="Scrippsiella Hangoei, Strain SHTV-5" /LENGTH=107 /DNA_ID=CAMNT_0050835171 /DNA_START=74 /DNA_END=394 /DNA_ORIENTATION=-